MGLIAKVKEGRVVKLEGNPEHPHSRGTFAQWAIGLDEHLRPEPRPHPVIGGKSGKANSAKPHGMKLWTWLQQKCKKSKTNTVPKR